MRMILMYFYNSNYSSRDYRVNLDLLDLSDPVGFSAMKTFLFAAALLLGAAACDKPQQRLEPLVRLTATASSTGFRLTLVPAPGARINARLKPVLELEGGSRIQFDHPALTADSAYFAAPPTAEFLGASAELKGVLRVGVCPAGANVCRSLAIAIHELLPRT